MNNLKEISLEINELLEKRRNELSLSFIEEDHIYYMKDIDGQIKNNFLSVSKIIKKFYEPFDSQKISYNMAKGDQEEQKRLLQEWAKAADYSVNMGSRVHYDLEKYLIEKTGLSKTVRTPIYTIDNDQQRRSDNMIIAGKKYLDLMEERGGVLLDTEIVLGDNELKYVGQPDKVWLFETADKSSYGLAISDWKTNQPKNFKVQSYTKKMFTPFENYHDTALTHYYLQLPLYARLLIKMLKNTKYENIKLLGGLIVLLKDDGEFEEYRIPKDITNKIMNINLTKYTQK